MAAGDALLRALYGQGRPRGVERGIGGKELRWQRNRQFGPGAFPPYGAGQLRPPPRPRFMGPTTSSSRLDRRWV